MAKSNKKMFIEMSSLSNPDNGHFIFFAKSISSREVLGVISIGREAGTQWRINEFEVVPSMQKLGIGSMLLRRAKKEVRKKGGSELKVSSTSSAKVFYQKRGMIPEESESRATHSWFPKLKPKQNPSGTSKRLPFGIAPQNLLRPEARLVRRLGRK